MRFLRRRRKNDESLERRCEICREPLPDDALECKMCGAPAPVRESGASESAPPHLANRP